MLYADVTRNKNPFHVSGGPDPLHVHSRGTSWIHHWHGDLDRHPERSPSVYYLEEDDREKEYG